MANKSSREWLREHFTDPYVKRAQKEGYRSRAVYKLLELHERYKLFKPGMTIVDLGAAPGGWSELVSKLIKPKGHIVAIDILPMDPIAGVDVMLGDFSDDHVANQLLEKITTKVDWVISDMAPNLSGNDSVDIPRSIYLCELALDFTGKVLKKDGGFLIKVFQGEGFDEYFATIKKQFTTVTIRKPKASRDRSREVYVLARGFKRPEEK